MTRAHPYDITEPPCTASPEQVDEAAKLANAANRPQRRGAPEGAALPPALAPCSLTHRREELGLSRAALSRRLGVDQSYISRLQTGARGPSLALVPRPVVRVGDGGVMADHDGAAFEAAQYLIALRKGGEPNYLPTAARIAWFRSESPEGQIVTEAIQIDERIAIFRAEVRRIVGAEVQGSATGYGSETLKDFADFIEKAETKAIGRALGALGYGTASAIEEATTSGALRIVDAPVEARAAPEEPKPISKPLGEKTNQRMHAAAGEKGIDHSGVRFCGWSLYGAETTKGLTDAEGRALGDWFERLAPVEAEYLGRLLAAPDEVALSKVAEAMKAGGVGNALLRSVFVRKARAFNAAS